jgi:hypothetical protein
MNRGRFKNLAKPTVAERDYRFISAGAGVQVIIDRIFAVRNRLEKQRAIQNRMKMMEKTIDSNCE